MNKNIPKTIKSLPLSPGIYKFLDKKGVVLYVGKANNLRNRVQSYFSKSSSLSLAKQKMVNQINDIEIIVADSGLEALILESIQIKKHKPKYNIVLKDDKSYNFVKIDYSIEMPTVTTVRRPEMDKGRSKAKYFGPFASGVALAENLRFLRRIFPYKKKKEETTIFEKELLEKRSLGNVPQTKEEYSDMIKKLERIINGQTKDTVKELKIAMQKFSSEKQYERAAKVRDQIKWLEIFSSRQKIVSTKAQSQDIVSIYSAKDGTAANVFIVREGKLIEKLNFILQHTKDKNQKEILSAFLLQYYSEATNPPKELIVPNKTSLTKDELNFLASKKLDNLKTKKSELKIFTKIIMPSRGKLLGLIKLGEKNAKEFLSKSIASSEKAIASLEELRNALGLAKIPSRIEGYDIANIQGEYSVGSMVVFIQGKPEPKEYKKFKIKTIKGADDFASLAEVVKRRFNHADWSAPDLVLLDGGRGQLSTVLNELYTHRHQHSNSRILGFSSHSNSRILQFSSHSNSRILRPTSNFAEATLDYGTAGGFSTQQFIALAKQKEEIFQGSKLKKINLDPSSESSKLLQRVRDEAHRFAHQYYSILHKKALIKKYEKPKAK